MPIRAIPSMLIVLLGGCFQSFGLEPGESADAGARDASFDALRVDAPPRPDGGPDASVPVPPDMCPPFAANLMLAQDVRAGEVNRVEVALGEECFCADRLGCSVSVRGRVIEIATTWCPSPALCAACEPFAYGECEIPALAEGSWEVRVNDTLTYELVANDERLPDGAQTQTGVAHIDDTLWPPNRDRRAETICFPTIAPSGRPFAMRAGRECPSCNLAGPCVVTRSGSELFVQTSELLPEGSVACPGICPPPRQDTCYAPALEEGTYQLWLDGVRSVSIVVRDNPPTGPETCTVWAIDG